MTEATQQPSAPSGTKWLVLRSLAGWRMQDLPNDLAAGLTLAAIAVPQQMATAKLGGFPPNIGLFVFVAATAAFALFGSNRYLSAGADSTIAPIFAGGLGLLAAQGSPTYFALAAALAAAVGIVMILAGFARLGFIASLLSVPVTTGFLAGIAIHIVVSQLPALTGLPAVRGDLFANVSAFAKAAGRANLYTLVIGGVVFGAGVAGERLRWKVPGTLIGLAAVSSLVAGFHLTRKGVAVVGATSAVWPHFAWPALATGDIGSFTGLTLIVATVVMVQTAATTRAFISLSDPRDVNRDFIGVGVGGIVSGLLGMFPVNASPSCTAAVDEAGGRSQIAGLAAAFLVALLIAFGGTLLSYVPLAGLAGVLLTVSLRIARPSTIALVLRQTPAEFALILATTAAIVILPIQSGVAIGIGLSLLQGLWTITRTRMIEFEKVPGTSVWWPPSRAIRGETLPHVRVIAFQAPLSFLNAEAFHQGMIAAIEEDEPALIVFEGSGVAEIDFTAAQILAEMIERCQKEGIRFAIARLSSIRAQQALVRFGIMDKLGPQGLYHSVDEAIRRLATPPEASPNIV